MVMDFFQSRIHSWHSLSKLESSNMYLSTWEEDSSIQNTGDLGEKWGISWKIYFLWLKKHFDSWLQMLTFWILWSPLPQKPEILNVLLNRCIFPFHPHLGFYSHQLLLTHLHILNPQGSFETMNDNYKYMVWIFWPGGSLSSASISLIACWKLGETGTDGVLEPSQAQDG